MAENPLSERETAFLGQIATGKTPTQAAYAVGYKSSGQGSKLWGDDRIRDAWKEAVLGEWGSIAGIMEDVRAGTRAERIELSRDGTPVPLGPDHHARAKFVDMLLKSMGMYPNPRLDVNLGTQNVLLIDSAKSPLAALDPFGTSVEAESVREIPADYNPEGGILPEDDFQIG